MPRSCSAAFLIAISMALAPAGWPIPLCASRTAVLALSRTTSAVARGSMVPLSIIVTYQSSRATPRKAMPRMSDATRTLAAVSAFVGASPTARKMEAASVCKASTSTRTFVMSSERDAALRLGRRGANVAQRPVACPAASALLRALRQDHRMSDTDLRGRPGRSSTDTVGVVPVSSELLSLQTTARDL